MKKSSRKKLLLVGAGHAHIGLLRRLSTIIMTEIKTETSTEHPSNTDVPLIDVTLISEQPQTIYSGMLPGWMAGHYQLDDFSIDIIALCSQANVEFVQRTIIKVNAESCSVTTTDNKSFDYDILSLNTGADTDVRWLNTDTTIDAHTISDVIPIRPLSTFIERWQQIIADAKQSSGYRLAIVGAGAAAAELVMAAQFALRCINPNHQATLICGEHLLSGFTQRFRQRVIKQLERHDITMIHARAIGYSNGLLSTTQESLSMDAVIAATGVMGAEWTAHTDLATVTADDSQRGFVAVNAVQQSISHPNVFAVGDVATRTDTAVAHSGVHAVHGGAVEADNLLAYLADESLQEYQPKSRTLYLLSCGDKYAIASWGKYSLQGRWVWTLKKYIDKRFVNSYKN